EPGQQHRIPVRGVYRGKLRLPRAQQRGEAPIITYRYVSHRAFHTEILRGESRPRRQRDRTVAGDGGNEQARGRSKGHRRACRGSPDPVLAGERTETPRGNPGDTIATRAHRFPIYRSATGFDRESHACSGNWVAVPVLHDDRGYLRDEITWRRALATSRRDAEGANGWAGWRRRTGRISAAAASCEAKQKTEGESSNGPHDEVPLGDTPSRATSWEIGSGDRVAEAAGWLAPTPGPQTGQPVGRAQGSRIGE